MYITELLFGCFCAIMGVLIVVMIAFLPITVYYSGTIKQELIMEKSGKKVSWMEAINYPEAYFLDGKMAITMENK